MKNKTNSGNSMRNVKKNGLNANDKPQKDEDGWKTMKMKKKKKSNLKKSECGRKCENKKLKEKRTNT